MWSLVDREVDAVFAASDTMALGALRAVRERGLSVPGNVAVVGFDGFERSQNSVPPLTTIRQPVSDTAARAVEMLLGLVSDSLLSPASDVLPVELLVRESTVGTRTSEGSS